MTSREVEIIETLAYYGDRFVTPMAVGGRDGSHHSATLRQLGRRGWVEVRKSCRDHHAGDLRCRCKGANYYRLSVRALRFVEIAQEN